MTWRVAGTGLCPICTAAAIARLYDDPAALAWLRRWGVRLRSLEQALDS
jgi:hypothetical protein